MTERNHIIVCWLLALSLALLPFTSPAGISKSPLGGEYCHEMNTAYQKGALSTDPAGEISPDALMLDQSCCDDCEINSYCVGMLGCYCRTGQISPFIAIDRYLTRHFEFVGSSIEQTTLRQDLTSPPDLRPPIV